MFLALRDCRKWTEPKEKSPSLAFLYHYGSFSSSPIPLILQISSPPLPPLPLPYREFREKMKDGTLGCEVKTRFLVPRQGILGYVVAPGLCDNGGSGVKQREQADSDTLERSRVVPRACARRQLPHRTHTPRQSSECQSPNLLPAPNTSYITPKPPKSESRSHTSRVLPTSDCNDNITTLNWKGS
ncbi:hypothetical protein WMY93_022748 [Mugilogobius chulae]|uniref:Uncharacterized protein n=1 Tax=Mugilogobius chulae TaxID=88201 RepID=A0AAW0N7T8_9GOBI